MNVNFKQSCWTKCWPSLDNKWQGFCKKHELFIDKTLMNIQTKLDCTKTHRFSFMVLENICNKITNVQVRVWFHTTLFRCEKINCNPVTSPC